MVESLGIIYKVSNSNKGRKLTPKQIKDRVKSRWRIIYPDKRENIIINLKDFCN